MIRIDPTATVSKLADIEDSTRGTEIRIGPRVVIDSFVKIKPAGGTENFEIGEGSVVNSGTVFYTGNGIRIGRNVLIAANCTLAPVNHEYRSAAKTIREQRFAPSKGGILIEDDVWLGAGSIVLDGAILRTGCVVGAGSIVRGELERYGVYAHNPLRLIRRRE